MPQIPISVVILTKNESAGIAETIGHMSEFAEVIVVDSHSIDGTPEIARRLGAKVVPFQWNGGYPKKKQWALSNAGAVHEWVLLLDADEYPSNGLKRELRDLFTSETSTAQYGAFDITLLYRFAGSFLSHGHRVTKRSLLHRDRSRFPEVDDLLAPGIREVEGHYQPETTARIGSLRSRLLHDDKDPVSSWFERHNKYSDWEAHLRMHPAARSDIASKRTRHGAIFDRMPAKPLLFFTYGYFFRLGFLDGKPGFDYHLALSMYYWQIALKTRELRRIATHAAN